MLLPNCTWDKFGDILAHNGGKLFGLFGELISLFSTMNMYSSSKSSVQDNREYQDFLQLFTGKAKKNRETSKNLFHANEKSASIPHQYKIYFINFLICSYWKRQLQLESNFMMLGFMQPQSALPIIQDFQNNTKGFTSRLMWYFPKPIYCRLEDLDLTELKQQEVDQFKLNLSK